MLFHTNIIQSADNQIRVCKFKKNILICNVEVCRFFPQFSTIKNVDYTQVYNKCIY